MRLVVSEFQLPDFLQADEDEIHERMLESPPRNYDVSEGGYFFDATMPVAMVKAKMISYNLAISLQMMFPQFAEGVFLDYHGESFKMPRHPPEKATGNVTFYGDEGTMIPLETVVMTSGTDDTPPIRYKTLEVGAEIDDSGHVTVLIEAIEPGVMGNVPADSIILLDSSISGVSSLNNEEPTLNGDEPEDDSHYRERILERRKNEALSGAIRDYERWAKEVEGVGEVIVLPEWNGAGTVKVLVTARSGGIASAELIRQVQEYIAPDGRKGEGVAPIGALVTVDTVAQLNINISFASIKFDDDYELSEIIKVMKESLSDYFSSLFGGALIFYNKISAIITNTKGIKDFTGLLVNEAEDNIQTNVGEVAVVGEVTYE